jgi:hypothetical protein
MLPVSSFLGLALSIKRLTRLDIQPLIDKLANKLAAWKGKMLDKAGRLALVKSVLSAIPVHMVTVLRI